MKSYIYIFFISLFMLTNGALFNWLFLGTPLSMWRQFIWILGLYILIKYYRNYYDNRLNNFLKLHIIFFIYIVFFSIITIILYKFNIMRIIYSLWLYLSGLPFILLPYFLKQFKLEPENFYKIFVYLGIFLTIGLVIDKISGGFFTQTFLISSSSHLEGFLEAKRYCFLSEAPTTFAIYYSFCLASALYLMYSVNKYKNKITYFFIALFFFIGAFFTGSRQIVAALGIVFIISIIYYILFTKDKKTHIILSTIILAILLPSIEKIIFSEEEYRERFSKENVEEDRRYKYWKEGFNETVLSNDITISLFGKAVALTQGQKAEDNEITGRHYENTIFSRWSELGILGVFFLFVPFIFIIKRMKKIDFFNIIIFSLFSSYVFICYVSPNGVHQITQMTIYIIVGLFLCKDYYLIRK